MVSFSLVTVFLRGYRTFGGDGIRISVRHKSRSDFSLVVFVHIIRIIGVWGEGFYCGIRILIIVF